MAEMVIKELPPLREWIKETGIDDVEAYIKWCEKCKEAAEEQYRKECEYVCPKCGRKER